MAKKRDDNKVILIYILIMLLANVLFFYNSWHYLMPAGADIPSQIFSSRFIGEGIFGKGIIPKNCGAR